MIQQSGTADEPVGLKPAHHTPSMETEIRGQPPSPRDKIIKDPVFSHPERGSACEC